MDSVDDEFDELNSDSVIVDDDQDYLVSISCTLMFVIAQIYNNN